MEMEKHKRKRRFNQEMTDSVLNNLLWEILLEIPNRLLESHGLQGEMWAGDVDIGDIMGQIVSFLPPPRPPNSYFEVLISGVAVFGDRVFKEASKVKWNH